MAARRKRGHRRKVDRLAQGLSGSTDLKGARLDAREARARVKAALAKIRAWCRSAAEKARQNAKAHRARELARIKTETQAMKDQARTRCRARKAAATKLQSITRALESRIKAERSQRLAFARADRARATQVKKLRSKREARAESTDEVASNLPADLVPLWRSMAHQFKATPRRSRTEAFLHWLEENPTELEAWLSESGDISEAEFARMQAEAVPF